MMRLLGPATVIIFALPLGALARGADPAAQAADGTGGMAWDLVRASGEGNAIVSPVSVWEALAMTHAGARGGTAAEIAQVLRSSEKAIKSMVHRARENLRERLAPFLQQELT